MAQVTDFAEILPTKQIVLESRAYQAMYDDCNLGAYFRSNLELDVHRSNVTDGLVYTLLSAVLGEKIADKRVTKSDSISLSRPTSWWQHFRQDVYPKLGRFGRWLLARKPVKLEWKDKLVTLTADFSQYAMFPAADIQTPRSVHKNVIVVSEGLSWR